MKKKLKIIALTTHSTGAIFLPNVPHRMEMKSGKDDVWWNSDRYTHQHLYIVDSGDAIKENDWVLLPPNIVMQMTNNDIMNYIDSGSNATKKIIASTDESLREWCLMPTISDEFINEYIKAFNEGKKINEVMVEYEDVGDEDWMGDDYNGEPFWNEKLQPTIDNQGNVFASQAIEEQEKKYTRAEVEEISKESYDLGYEEGYDGNDYDGGKLLNEWFNNYLNKLNKNSQTKQK